ncbi:MAG: SAM-dependent methyltransferase [Desulfatibacillaceae bacterium]
MNVWIVAAIGFFALLFAVKLVYVLSTALALPATRGALFVGTSNARIDAFLDAVPMKPDDLFVDLGCGDGRVLYRAGKRFGVRGEGYELNLLAWVQAWLRHLGHRDVAVHRRNFFTADLTRADVVFCYLFPDVMADIGNKLSLELKPGAVAVSANFPIPGWSPRKVVRPAGDMDHDPIYIYDREGAPGVTGREGPASVQNRVTAA